MTIDKFEYERRLRVAVNFLQKAVSNNPSSRIINVNTSRCLQGPFMALDGINVNSYIILNKNYTFMKRVGLWRS